MKAEDVFERFIIGFIVALVFLILALLLMKGGS